MRALAVDLGLVLSAKRRRRNRLGALFVGDGAETRGRRAEQGALGHAGGALLDQKGGHGLASAHLGDRRGDVKPWTVAVGLGRALELAPVVGSKGAERVLHTMAELRQDVIRHVARLLGDEEDANALGADQPRHLLHLVDQRLGCIVEQEVCLVEEEHELRLVRGASLLQFLEELREEPHQDGRVEPR